MEEENKVDSLFSKDVSDRERAAFELGIKMGALFHMSMGIPISKNKQTLDSLERALENSILCQPYVSNVSVKLTSSKVHGDKTHQFDYSSINPENLGADITVKYKNTIIKGKIEWNDKLHYPLMRVIEISEEKNK